MYELASSKCNFIDFNDQGCQFSDLSLNSDVFTIFLSIENTFFILKIEFAVNCICCANMSNCLYKLVA